MMLDPLFSNENKALLWMNQAMELAQLAAQNNEVPVGALVIGPDGEIIGKGYNQPIGLHDPSAHAEIRALRDAAVKMGNYRLPGCTMVVTLEPCLMCVGAILHARIAQVYFGAYDPKTGACGSVLDFSILEKLNHQTQFTGGIEAQRCGQILRDFFVERRTQFKLKNDSSPS